MKVLRIATVALPAILSLAAPTRAAAQDSAAGERLFRQRCGTCHSVEAGQNRMGPHLAGVIGRASGSVEGARYSRAMGDLDIVWDAEQIRTFIANPRAMLPGTTMMVAVPNEADRNSIVAYLETLATGQ